MRRRIQYEEVQQFRQPWLWYLLITSSLTGVLPVIVVAFADNDTSVREAVLVIAIVLGITLLNLAAFYYVRLEVRFSDEGIHYRWWPFFRAFSLLRWKDIDHVSIQKYTPFKFGFSISKKYGRVHNVDGNMGYQVILQNGKKYFFGTQKRLAVENVLQQTGKLKQ